MRVLTLLAPGFEEIEAITVIDILRRADIQVLTASIGEKTVTGSHNIPVIADALLDEITGEDYEACFLPGGQPGTQNLMSDRRVLELVRTFHDTERFVTAICAAPTVLLKAGILTKHQVTSYPSEKEKFDPGFYRENDVVADDRIITSRGVGTAIPFALKLTELWVGNEKAEQLARQIVFNSKKQSRY